MNIKGWKYYNHAAVPDIPIDMEPDLMPVKNGGIWELTDGVNKPVLARYTTNFDCSEETNFWYVVKDGPFVFDDLSSKYKRSVKTSLKRCEVIKIEPLQYIKELFEVYESAYTKYHEADNRIDITSFSKYCENSNDDWWAAFSVEDHIMIGYIICKNFETYAETVIAKYNPEYQRLRQSDAMHYVVLDYYLNTLKKKFILSGARSINHKTNVQDYEISNWKYRKAYCKLHVIFNKKYRRLITVLFPFRKFFLLFDKIVRIHQLNSLLKMYELSEKD